MAGACFSVGGWGLHFYVGGHPMGDIGFGEWVQKKIIGWGGGGLPPHAPPPPPPL